MSGGSSSTAPAAALGSWKFFWGVNGILICNSGTATTQRLRGRTPSSWNEIHIDASTIKVFLHYPDGRQELSVLVRRKTRAMTREAFSLADDFLASNQILVPRRSSRPR